MYLNNLKRRRREKELSTIGNNVILELERIKNGLVRMEQRLEEINIMENAMRNFDDLKRELEGIEELIRFIEALYNGKESEEEIEDIKLLINKIWVKITQYGSISKKEVLSRLEEIDIYLKGDFTKKGEKIKKILERVSSELELDNMRYEDDFKDIHIRELRGKRSNCIISNCQIWSFEDCIKHSSSNNISEAIHSLYEFIENFNCSSKLPFNSFERITIKIMINHITLSMGNMDENYIIKIFKEQSIT